MIINSTAPDRRLRTMSFAALALFVAHACEEWLTRMFDVDPVFRAMSRLSYSAPKIAFIAFQLTWLLSVTVLLLVVRREPWRRRLLIALAGVCVIEVQHVVLALLRHAYYPGAVTSAVLVVFSFFYIRELHSAYRPRPRRDPNVDSVH